MTIGERIRQRREELNLSQEELAHRLGYKSRSSINKIELNTQNLKQSKIKAIADALETTPAYIMGWEDEKVQRELKCCELFEQCYGKEAFRVVSNFLLLDGTDRANIDGMIRVMLDNEKYIGKKDVRNA